MPESEPVSPGASTSTLTCGHCGTPVPPDAVMCPACGVLLAAYQVAGGAIPSDPPPSAPDSSKPSTPDMPPETSETGVTPSPYPTPGIADPVVPPETSDTGMTPSAGSTPSFTMPVFSTPPDHSPRSHSPIGDALRTSSETGIGRGTPDTRGHSRYMDELTRMGNPASELSAMASGVDDLADMADGVDELADMADGNDELSKMAGKGSGTGSGLAAEVEAELAGARVTFAGNRPVIESELVEVTQTPGAAPAVVTPKPARPTPRTPVAEPQPRAQAATRTGVYDTPVSQESAITTSSPGPKKSTAVPWIPLVLMVGVVLVFARIVPAAGGILGLVLVAGLVWGLLKWTSATSRKTTAMPKDTDWNKKRPRF